MVTRDDILPLATGAGTAAAAGIALALGLGLPPELARPATHFETFLADAVDPNLASYRQMAAAEGADLRPYVLAAVYEPAPRASSAALRSDAPAADAPDVAEPYPSRDARAELARTAWLAAQRQTWRAQANMAPADEGGDEGDQAGDAPAFDTLDVRPWLR